MNNIFKTPNWLLISSPNFSCPAQWSQFSLSVGQPCYYFSAFAGVTSSRCGDTRIFVWLLRSRQCEAECGNSEWDMGLARGWSLESVALSLHKLTISGNKCLRLFMANHWAQQLAHRLCGVNLQAAVCRKCECAYVELLGGAFLIGLGESALGPSFCA